MKTKLSAQKFAALIATLTVAVASAILPMSASAASITWGAATTISGDTDVSTSGSLLYAYDVSNSGITVNTVPFAAGNSATALGGDITISGFGSNTSNAYSVTNTPTAWSGLSTAYKTMLQGGIYGSAAAGTVTLNHLTVGHSYQVQVWVNDPRNNSRNETNSSSGGNTVTLSYDTTGVVGGVGQYAIGTFTASATTQAFTMQGNSGSGSSQINAIQVRDQTTAASGTWNTTTSGALWGTAGNWSGNIIATGSGKTADFSQQSIAADTTVNLDSSWSVGNLIFGNTAVSPAANWILANNGTAGNALMLQGSSPTVTVNNLGTGKSASISAVISGSAGLVKAGAGTLVFSSANTYSGGTTVSAGTLQMGVANAVPSGGVYTGDVTNNATLDLNTFNDTINALNGTGTVDTVAGGSPILTVGASGSSGTFSGIIKNTAGTLWLVKAGGGVQTLSGTNTYSGPTIVNGGTLTLIGNQTNSYGSFYVGTNTAAVGLNIGATTQTVPTTLVVASNATVLTASGASQYSGINVNGASGVPTYVTNNGTMSIGRDSGFAVNNYATWVQNSNLTVQANGGYPGNFTVAAGGTYIYNGVNPANFSAPVSSGNASISIAGTFYTAQPINFNDNGSTGYPLVNLNGGTLLLGANLNPLFISSRTNSGPLGQVQVSANGTLNTAGYSATITNRIVNASGQNGSLVVNGGGTLTLTDTNVYSGGTIVNASTLVLTNGGPFGIVINNLTLNSNALVQLDNVDSLGYWGGISVTNVNINNSTLTNASGGNEGYGINFALNGGTMSSSGGSYLLAGGTIASLSNSVSSSFVNAPITIRGNVLTLSAAAGTVPGGVDLNISGNLNQFDASDAVIKNGAGEILFSGTGNYSGSTTINAGKLVLASTASLPNTTNFAVAAGATLDVSAISGFTLGGNQGISGSGTVNGSVADNGGSQFSPGGFNTVGTLTFNNNLTLAGSDTLNFDFNTNANDVINVSGTLTPSGTTIINLANWPTGGFKQANYVLIQATSLAGNAGNFYLQNAPTTGRQTYNIVYNTSSSPQQVLLQVTGYNANLVWQGGSGNAWDIQITQDWLNGGTADYFYTSDSVLFSNVPQSNASVNITPASVAPGTVTFNSTNNYVFTGGGGYITGSASLTKNGSGSVTLTTANDYTGGTTVNGGTLQLGDGVSYNGSVAGAIVNNATLVVSNASSQVLNNNISGSGKTIAGGTTDLTIGGNISGAQQVVGNASGGLILSGTNSYTGGTVVSNGVVIAANATALGVPASGVLATVNGGATLAYQVAGTQTLTNQIVGAGSLVYSNGNPGTAGQPLNYGLVGLVLATSNNFAGGTTINIGSVYAYNNNALGTGPVTLDNGNGYGTYGYNQIYVGNGRNISNAITVVNASDYFNGVLMVDPGPNGNYGASDTNGGTFSGPITVAAGAVIAHGGLFCGPGSGTNWLVIAGPVTNLNSGGGITMRNGRTRFSGGGSYDVFSVGGGLAQIGANNGIATNAALWVAGGSFDLNGYSQMLTGLSNPGGGTVNNSSMTTSTLTLNLTSSSTYGSVISGKVNLVVNGSSSLYLSGTNTYTGNTTVNGGTLEIAQPTFATNSTVTVAGGAVLQLDFTVTNTVGSLVLGGSTQSPGVYDSSTPGGYITGSGSLVVNSSIATNPTNITFTVTGNTLNLSWPADHQGWLVQSNSVNLAVPADWYDISSTAAGTSYSIPVDVTKTNVFYRLRKP